MEFVRIVGGMSVLLSSAVTLMGCSVEAADDGALDGDIEQVEEAIGTDCAAASPTATFAGAINYTSPRTYDTAHCTKAVVLDVSNYAFVAVPYTPGVSGQFFTDVSWADVRGASLGMAPRDPPGFQIAALDHALEWSTMPSAFSRTLRSLELDTSRPAMTIGACALPLLAGWLCWATLARAPVYAVSSSARTEIEGSVIPVDVFDQGRVVRSELLLGRRVEQGDVLVELDTTLEKARLEEMKVRRAAVEKRLEPLRKQRDALFAILEVQRKVGSATVNVATMRASAARREAERQRERADISRQAAAAGIGSKVSEIESSLAAQRQSDTAREGAAELSRTAMSQALEVQRLALQDVEFTRALVDAESELLSIEAQIRTLETSIEHRTVRAIVTGYLGDVAPVIVGMTVSPGRPLATIIPERSLRMVAYFAPAETVGRMSAGQKAFLRFQGFPWVQFGIPEGTVRSVGVEPHAGDKNGDVRVEIEIQAATATRIPLQHGMPAAVEVLVDEATPWEMLLRSVGGVMAPGAASDASAGKDRGWSDEAPR
jgi:multidrug resistance efflux pump